MIAAIVALGAAALAPVGPWSVKYEGGFCILSRPYGEAADPTFLAIRQIPHPQNQRFDLLVMAPGRNVSGEFPWGGQARITLLPSNQSFKSPYTNGKVSRTREMVELTADIAVFDALKASTTITVSLVHGSSFTFALSTSAAGIGALDQCKAGLLKQWGVDAAREAAVVRPPKSIAGAAPVFSAADYPAMLKAAKIGGIAVIVWEVTREGLSRACRVVISSGQAELDQASCEAIERRARFKPALDGNGLATPYHIVKRIIWVP